MVTDFNSHTKFLTDTNSSQFSKIAFNRYCQYGKNTTFKEVVFHILFHQNQKIEKMKVTHMIFFSTVSNIREHIID